MKYLLDSHTHTIASGHAYNTINEMVQSAAEQGLELLAITEHSMTMPGTCSELYFHNLQVLPREIGGIEVLFGAEVNIMDTDGTMDMDDVLMKQMDVIVASMHLPCMEPGTREENTRACLNVMAHPYVNILGHPDDGRYPVDYEALVKGAKAHHVLLELNNGSLRPNSSRLQAHENAREMLELCMRYEVPIIVNSDSHCIWEVASRKYTQPLLDEVRFPDELIANYSLEMYKKYVNRYNLDKK